MKINASKKRKHSHRRSGFLGRLWRHFTFPFRKFAGLLTALYLSLLRFFQTLWESVPVPVAMGVVGGILLVLFTLLVLAGINDLLGPVLIGLSIFVLGFLVLLILAGVATAFFEICFPVTTPWVRRARSVIGALALGFAVGFVVYAFTAGQGGYVRNLRTGEIMSAESHGLGGGLLTGIFVFFFAAATDSDPSNRKRKD